MIKWVFSNYFIFPIEVVDYEDDCVIADNGEFYPNENVYSTIAEAKLAALSYADLVIQNMMDLRFKAVRTDESQFPLTNPDFYKDIF